MEELPYTNRELDEKLQDIMLTLDRIETQTTKTNGRVRSLEVWRGVIIGGLGVITALVIPVAFALFAK